MEFEVGELEVEFDGMFCFVGLVILGVEGFEGGWV